MLYFVLKQKINCFNYEILTGDKRKRYKSSPTQILHQQLLKNKLLHDAYRKIFLSLLLLLLDPK